MSSSRELVEMAKRLMAIHKESRFQIQIVAPDTCRIEVADHHTMDNNSEFAMLAFNIFRIGLRD